MQSKLMELAIAIKGKIDSSLPASVRRAASSMQDLQRKAQELRSVSRKADAWKAQTQRISDLNDKLKQATQRSGELANAVFLTNQSSKKTVKAYNRAQHEVEKLNASLSKEQTRLEKINGELRAAGFNTDEFAKSYGKLQRTMNENQAGINWHTRNQALEDNRNKASVNLFSAYGNLQYGVGIATAAAAPLAGAISTAANFESAMSKVQAITRANSEEMQRLNANARMLGETTQFSATQAADAMSYLGMAGWNADQIIAGMPGLLSLAAAGGTDLARTADIVSDDLTAFGLDADKAGHMADVFAVTITRTNTNVEMLGETMKYAAPVAKAFGASMEETAALAGIMANAGIKASQAGTSLRAGFLRLAGPTKKSQKAMEELGISFSDATKQQMEAQEALQELGIDMDKISGSPSHKMAAVLEELRTKMDGLSGEQKLAHLQAIFGTEAAAGWLNVIDAAPGTFENLVEAMENSNGEADKMAQTMMNNAKGASVQLQSAMESLAISVGSVFLPSLTSAARSAAAMAGSLAGWVSEHPKIVAALASIAAAVTAVVLAVLSMGVISSFASYTAASFALLQNNATRAAGSVVSAFIRMQAMAQGLTISSALQAASNGFRAFGSAIGVAAKAARGFIFSPIGAVLAAIALAAYLIYTNWDKVGPFLEELWGRITGIFSSAYQTLQPALSALGSAWDNLMNAFQGASGTFAPLIERVGVLANLLGGVLFAEIILIANVIVGVLSAAVETVARIIAGVADVITGVIQVVTGLLTGDWSTAWEGATNIVKGAADIIEGIVGGMGRFIEGIIGGIANGFRKIAELARGAPTPAQSNLAAGMSAEGGVFTRPYLTWVAEGGDPEVIVPINRTQRAAALWQTAGSMLGMIPNVQSAAPVMGPALEPVREPISSTSNNAVTVNFSPTINVSGAGTGAADQIRAALVDAEEELEARIRRIVQETQARERRLSFE